MGLRLMSLQLIGQMGHIGRMGRMGLMGLIGLMSLMSLPAQGQIKVGGNVYGGGNKALVEGNTRVTVKAGDIGHTDRPDNERPLANPKGRVFGGARMADVGGNAFVHIDGENATDYIVVNYVYGGNDVAGTVGTKPANKTLPTELTEIKKTEEDNTNPKKNAIDSSWDSYVRISTKATDAEKIYIGQLFGGGNGDFDYEDKVDYPTAGRTTHYIYNRSDVGHSSPLAIVETANGEVGFKRPELAKAYLEVVGGSIVYAYGGGNNATVKEETVIHVDNPSDVVNHILVDADGVEANATTYATYAANEANGSNEIPTGYTDLLCTARFKEMGINTSYSKPSSAEFQIGRFFGGNNKAEMAIRPTWNLQGGKIRNLYSGGNKGNMTSPEGLLLDINPVSTNTTPLIVDYVFGGCRMADVKPTVDGVYTPCTNLPGYNFPNELSARVLVKGGHINNVYGGNDVTGTVYGGNAVGIYTTVYGNVYGGGNGAYPYTNNATLANSDIFGDLYYEKGSHATWLEALNAHRPNAEQVSIRLAGKGPGANMTNVHGSIFVGGNCASLATVKENPLVELKIGSHVIADKVFLGNNGEEMVDPEMLSYYAGSVDADGNVVAEGGTDFSNGFDLTTANDMAAYMNGAAMPLQSRIVFDDANIGDPATYEDNTSYVGSFYCGGNVGSMIVPGKNTYSISRKLNIFEKFVGGCNNSYVAARDGLNAAYDGGILGSAAEQLDYTEGGKIKDRLEINLENLTITPLRWKDDQTQLVWNTNKWDDDENDFVPVENSAVDKDTRLLGGNVYGGCYNSGHVNGNITININEDELNRSEVFGNGTGPYGNKASGVELVDQRDDVMAVALSVFGAGYGEATEVWGSTTVNLNKGYAFQIFGGGEKGVVGKKNDSGDYEYNPAYSSTVNLKGLNAGYSESETGAVLAETEYIYGGGNEGDVCGNTYVNLGNGRIYDAFGGASDADILGHTEVYIGRSGVDASGNDIPGFPWVRDIVYGGNDFGGTIHREGNMKGRVRVETGTGAFDVLGKVHNPGSKADPDVLQASTYVEYLQGRVDSIFGGSYGNYDYTLEKFKDDEGNSPTLPLQNSSFVNIRPSKENNSDNRIVGIFGGGTGYPGNRDGDRSQNRSYVLVDIPDNLSNFRTTEIFGAGSYNGMGMNSQYDPTTHKTLTIGESPTEITDLDNLSAIVDLVRGKVGAAYGGSYMEGVTRRTMVNVPTGSTINIGSIFGGAYGKELLAPCDVYEAHVNYSSTDATLVYNDGNPLMKGSIYGGNNTCRRTIYGFIDIDAPVWQQHPKWGKTRATVYGAGCGPMTWSEYSEVNLKKKPDGVTGDYAGAEVYEVYGGAQNGEVLNAESAKAFMNSYLDITSPSFPSYLQAIVDAKGYSDTDWRTKVWPDAWTIGEGYYTPYTYDEGQGKWIFTAGNFDSYATNEATNLSNPLARTAEMDDRDTKTYKYSTNVLINDGAYVANYAYGGGLGSTPGTGDVFGTTYIALLGGEVKKDIYAAGTNGVVYDNYRSGEFVASANAYIKSGTCRNVYGGGWEGSVGKHDGDLSDAYYDFTNDEPLDIPGETHVVIGDIGDDKTFANGKPAIQRNVYGGGEGGSVFGTTHLTINNGMIGYRWKNSDYVAELDDKAAGDNELDGSGNAFGGGYILNSFVDNTNVKMMGGQIRGSLYGGGEVGPVGRGSMKSDALLSGGVKNGKATIYKAGKTHVEMYNGHVLRNVFGGGRGKDSWDGDGTYSMDPAVVATLDHDSKGFVFGQTEVNIYGGEVGTDEGMARNFGNVFGGGDEGTVVSAYEKDDHTLGIGKKIGVRYGEDAHEGYYFKYENGTFLEEGTGTDIRNVFTEDCKVLVEPWLQVKKEAGIDFDADGDGPAASTNYPKGSYIPTAYLNTLKAKTGDIWPSTWDEVDVGKNVEIDDKTVFKERGIVIHNAVFAGGNIALGSNSLNANEITVYGNATASIHDVYNRDFITIGTGHTGGLYGDGNLTLVDGYRELNITNYGSDKFHLANELGITEYNTLPDREKAYYEVKYKCIAANGCTDREGTVYKGGDNGATLPPPELLTLFTKDDGTSIQNNASGAVVESGGTAILVPNASGQLTPNSTIWRENGVVSTYAGRIMNTIQRADFCGVFGSRMVMKGARDRVPDKEDSKLYTINRVREVSLNKMDTPAGDTDDDNKMHGNYFGIYSNVNYFGSLTSDVDFHTTRRTTNANIDQNPGLAADGKTFAEWKAAHKTERSRNNGYCYNQLALASGVYLELTTEKSTGTTVDTKDWGLITGVVELDLINVQTGVGGGYVYAKNEHGKRKAGHQNTTLTALNNTAVSKWNWDYETADALREEWETSGNFIHSSQTIIDDCYNESARYLSTNFVKAHYWFISGQVYVYDQYITAHTGSPNAYSETVELPITINAASNGKMTLMDVQPNLYAYYSSYTNGSTYTKLSGDAKVVINNNEYHLNDPISYWDWYKLPASERRLFVEDTYVIKEDCKIRNTSYTAGTVLLKKEYDALAPVDDMGTRTYPPTTHVREVDGVDQDVAVPFVDVVRSSNNMSHDTGYLLVYNMTNPEIWKPWYTELTGSSRDKKITTAAYDALPAATTTVESVTTLGKDAYYDGPTYTPTTTGLYGQREYDVMDIIPEKIYNDYQTLSTGETTASYIPTDEERKQAVFVPAYVVTKEYTSGSTHLYPGAPVSSEISGYTAPAYVCTSTIELSSTNYVYVNDLMTASEKAKLIHDYPELTDDINKYIVRAYYCTTAGLYGGDVYVAGRNYRALNIWSTMPEAERNNFTFNYDALDLLVDPTYGVTYTGGVRTMQKEGHKYQYDGYQAYSDDNKANMIYSLSKPIDYTATYNGGTGDVSYDGGTAMTYTDADNPSTTQYVKVGQELGREAYEALPNEQRHYAPITVKVGDTVQDSYTIYVVKDDFVHIETPYAVGSTVDADTYARLTSDEKANVITLTFAKGELDKDGDTPKTTTFYYCRESYEVNEKGMGKSVKSVKGEGNGTTYTANATVPKGAVIADGDYSQLPNKQQHFTIHGKSPMETSTLYVSRQSDINDLTKEKIITVIYKYDYEESDVSGLHVTPVSERHIVNIHIKFESGVPIVDDIRAPGIVLPGTSINMRIPTVTPGAYEILGGGWELFEKDTYAENHTNGMAYKPSVDSLYWYQDGYLLAYYAKTYMGKTYSNAVPVSVANYHDLKKVMDDKKYHLHVDYDRSQLKRASKVYINDYSSSSENGLDLFKNFYDLSLLTTDDVNTDAKTGLITTVKDGSADSPFKGHALLNTHATNGVKAGHNLDFFLRTDIEHTDSWTPIASTEGDDPCFNGTLHGDGHTISGLNKSLFGKLCGNVYNLGVTGSFTSAGVADEGDGYVESCWVKTSGTPAADVKAVFGGSSSVSHEQTVNCYYPETNTFTEGKAKAMPERAFYNGTVAYNLNNFYLYKRYNDHAQPGGTTSYKYWQPGNDTPQSGTYANNAANCSSGYNGIKYVEERYADGDFRYAAGTIPGSEDERYYVESTEDPETHVITETDRWAPIWPDDYLFFGQKLTYGYSDTEAHQTLPSAIVKNDNNRLPESEQNNRVYRAPAYYGNSTMGVAHFNPTVYLAQTKKGDAATKAYPGMTAIDFRGHNDVYGANGATKAFELGLNDGKFYAPLLDDDGLTDITNCDETKNLLAYAPASGDNAKTHTVLADYFVDPDYDTYYDNSAGYRLVRKNDKSVYGHLIQSNLVATNDHLLVDKQDFNCPIAYRFDDSHLMWYQRIPEETEYVTPVWSGTPAKRSTKGWQGVSIPFTAELVTTSDKGEITHFYGGSETSKNGTDSKIGHEYWLREFKAGGTTSGKVYEAKMNYPDAASGNKEYTNTFLWNYYYQYADQKDANDDTYQTYYKTAHTHSRYPLLTGAKPYIIGLPSATYYEFDLSGSFEAQNTKVKIDRLGQQIITFASEEGAGIKVSDTELSSTTGSVTYDGYTFKASYANKEMAAGTFVMNSDGNAYHQLSETAETNTTNKVKTSQYAFRPYFVTAAAGSRSMARSIIFGGADAEEIKEGPGAIQDGGLDIYVKNHKIVTTSHLKEATAVSIVSVSGVTMASYVLQPGETVETPIRVEGAYIVNKKKLLVK